MKYFGKKGRHLPVNRNISVVIVNRKQDQKYMKYLWDARKLSVVHYDLI